MAEADRRRSAEYWFGAPPAPSGYGTGQGTSDKAIAAMIAQQQQPTAAQRIQDAMNQAENQKRRFLASPEGAAMIGPLVHLGLGVRQQGAYPPGRYPQMYGQPY